MKDFRIMKRVQYFFRCYFNQAFDYDALDWLIDNYKTSDSEESTQTLISELHQLIQTNNYELAAKIMLEYGGRDFNSLEKTEKFIKYIYNRFLEIPTDVKAEDFYKKVKCVFCPICTPKIVVDRFSLIKKATVIGKDLQIFICKYCKVMWPTEDIRADNSTDYKKFMRTLGLKGTWKELCDVDDL